MLSFFLTDCLGSGQTPELSLPECISSFGGTNFAFYGIKDAYLERNEPNSWWTPGVLNHIVGAFHMQKANEIYETLGRMYMGGQRKIALVIWHLNIDNDKLAKGSKWKSEIPVGYENIYGHNINSSGGSMCLQHKKNLAMLLDLIEQIGFENVTIRFAPQGVNDPAQWGTWQEKYYKENMDFIFSAKQVSDRVLKNSKAKVFFDLGLELGGLETGRCGEYSSRLWKQYTDKFGTKDTVGFSFAVEPGRITRMLDIYQKSGHCPSAYPLDIYFDADRVLDGVAEEFHNKGISNPAIIIQETFYNDAQTLGEIQTAAKKYKLNILYIMQWQVERARMYCYRENGNRYLRHFSISCPIEYNNYLKQPD